MPQKEYILKLLTSVILSLSAFFLLLKIIPFILLLTVPLVFNTIIFCILMGSYVLLIVLDKKLLWLKILLFIIESLLLILVFLVTGNSYMSIFINWFSFLSLSFLNLIIVLFLITPKNILFIEVEDVNILENIRTDLSIIKTCMIILFIMTISLIAWDIQSSILDGSTNRFDGVCAIVSLPATMLLLIGGYIYAKRKFKQEKAQKS